MCSNNCSKVVNFLNEFKHRSGRCIIVVHVKCTAHKITFTICRKNTICLQNVTTSNEFSTRTIMMRIHMVSRFSDWKLNGLWRERQRRESISAIETKGPLNEGLDYILNYLKCKYFMEQWIDERNSYFIGTNDRGSLQCECSGTVLLVLL